MRIVSCSLAKPSFSAGVMDLGSNRSAPYEPPDNRRDETKERSIRPWHAEKVSRNVAALSERANHGAMRNERERALGEVRNVVDRMPLAEPPHAVQRLNRFGGAAGSTGSDLWASSATSLLETRKMLPPLAGLF